MIEFIKQFLTLSLLIIFLTSLMLMGWPALLLMVTIIIIFSAELINKHNK